MVALLTATDSVEVGVIICPDVNVASIMASEQTVLPARVFQRLDEVQAGASPKRCNAAIDRSVLVPGAAIASPNGILHPVVGVPGELFDGNVLDAHRFDVLLADLVDGFADVVDLLLGRRDKGALADRCVRAVDLSEMSWLWIALNDAR
jgi:hypothetical protein